MAERNTAEELDDVYEIKYSTDAMTGGANDEIKYSKIRIL
jgi:hypothetical protein